MPHDTSVQGRPRMRLNTKQKEAGAEDSPIGILRGATAPPGTADAAMQYATATVSTATPMDRVSVGSPDTEGNTAEAALAMNPPIPGFANSVFAYFAGRLFLLNMKTPCSRSPAVQWMIDSLLRILTTDMLDV